MLDHIRDTSLILSRSMLAFVARRRTPTGMIMQNPVQMSRIGTGPSLALMFLQAESCAALNREAVGMLSLGNYLQANSLLSAALHQLASKISNHDGEAKESASCTLSFGRPENFISVRRLEVVNNEEDDRSFALCHHLFVIDADDDQLIGSNEGEGLLSAVLLYNMAISYHSLALNSSCQQLRHYKAAIRLYTSAWKLLVAELPIHGPAFKLMFMALVNNKAQLYSSLYDQRMVRFCLEWLQYSLQTCRHWLLEIDDIFFFQSNALLFQQALDNHAAAA